MSAVSRQLWEVKGFDELQKKLKSLPDKMKRREVIKILRRAARDTVKEARNQAPKSKKAHVFKRDSKSVAKVINPGHLRKSIKVAVPRKSENPMVFVGPRSSGKYDGFYGRAWVIPGHKIRGGKKIAPDPFMERAFDRTEGKISRDSVAGVEKYLKKLIDKL